MHPKVNELNNLRLKLGLTTYRIWKETNISIRTLDNFFQGKHIPKIDLYFKINDYLKSKEV
jgi:transcriptional regulator with XRE-family HTH domain